MIIVPLKRNWDDWRSKARELLAQKIPPQDVHWKVDEFEFAFGEEFVHRNTPNTIQLPKDFIEMAYTVSLFRDDSTWELLYRVAWRILHENRQLMKIQLDPDVRELMARQKSVGRDLHKMHAFVRFREIKQPEGESVYMAWHRPDHRILRLAAPFFKDRFNGMKWVIMTEDESMSWDKKQLVFLPGVLQHELPADEKEDLWKTYYSSIFNPARVKVGMMKKEMAVRYWGTLPEAQLITSLIDQAPARVNEFYQSQAPLAPIRKIETLDEIKVALKECAACGICSASSGPVAGIGPKDASLAFIGEQPGNEEDLKGEPFIGPAGKELMAAFHKVGIKREEVYLSNAVKGFKWIKGYVDRQHKNPYSKEISACRPWLQNELNIVKPKILVCLGRTAAQSVLGKMIKLEDERGRFFSTPFSDRTIVLPHPASLLRMENAEDQELARARFLQEMQMIKHELAQIA